MTDDHMTLLIVVLMAMLGTCWLFALQQGVLSRHYFEEYLIFRTRYRTLVAKTMLNECLVCNPPPILSGAERVFNIVHEAVSSPIERWTDESTVFTKLTWGRVSVTEGFSVGLCQMRYKVLLSDHDVTDTIAEVAAIKGTDTMKLLSTLVSRKVAFDKNERLSKLADQVNA